MLPTPPGLDRGLALDVTECQPTLRPGRLSSLARVRIATSANADVVDWLREATDRPTGRIRGRRRVRPEELRCHHDLCDRLQAISEGLTGTRTRYVGGMPLLLDPAGVAYALGAGTSWISLRLPRHVHSAVVRSDWGRRGLEDDWIDIDPWLTDMNAREGLRRLRGWTRAAYVHAGELAAAARARAR